MSNNLSSRDYSIGWICALSLELAAAKAMLDELHPTPSDYFQNTNDRNAYNFGRVGKHNVVIAVLPAGRYGNNNAAMVATSMSFAFPWLQFYLMVGIGGGIPSKEHDIRLGDVVVSKPGPGHPGVLQHDFGKIGRDGVLKPAGILNKPPQEVLAAVAALEANHMMHENKIPGFVSELAAKYPQMQATFSYQGAENDILFRSRYNHVEETPTCESCDRSKVLSRKPRSSNIPVVHYGLIASANQVIKNGVVRDKLRVQHNVLCVEMEAAGLMDSIPCLVVRGVCDYADSHKNKRWQQYAAATAAAYTKELLLSIVRQTSGMEISGRQRGVASSGNVRLPSWEDYQGNEAAVRRGLLQNAPNRSPDPRAWDKMLLEAVKNGDESTAKQALHKKADPNTKDENWGLTPLHHATRKGHAALVRILLNGGANANSGTRYTKDTPMIEAARKGRDEIIEILFTNGANIMTRGRTNRTPLHEAAERGHLQAVDFLLKNGADRNTKDARGETALDLATSGGHKAVELCLKEQHLRQ